MFQNWWSLTLFREELKSRENNFELFENPVCIKAMLIHLNGMQIL